MSYIPPNIVEDIKAAARVEDIVADYVKLGAAGSDLVGDCPQCLGKKKLSVSPRKQIWKCWTCDLGGGDAISFLTSMMHKPFPDALREVAHRYSIDIPEEAGEDDPAPTGRRKKRRKAKEKAMSFRDRQLLASGITDEAQKWKLREGADTEIIADRYETASIDQAWHKVPGDDMLLHYLDLPTESFPSGQPMTYVVKGGKEKPVIRVRWQNPNLHRDANGKPIKYQTPPGCPSPLWIPQWLINAYQKHAPLGALYITEGEKKADALCLAGLPAVGITGIHNLSNGAMPRQIEKIIRRGQITRVCFLLDSDWDHLKAQNGKDISQRPKLFFSAVRNFRDYFQAFALEDLEIQIFFAYGKDLAYKGVDDLLARGLQEDLSLADDLEAAYKDRAGQGTYLRVVDITSMSDYKLRSYWHLESPQSFRQHHEKELLELREFYQNGLKYRVVDRDGRKIIELDQKLMPHEQYWIEERDDEGKIKKLLFDYLTINDFLRNRGYCKYWEEERKILRFIYIDGKVIREVKPIQIKEYVHNFTEEIGRKDVARMLMRGSNSYLTPQRLENMRQYTPQWMQPEREAHYLIFKDQFWRITAERISKHPLSELPGPVWDNRILDFSPTLLDPMIDVSLAGDEWEINWTNDLWKQCDIAQFFMQTSSFFWRNTTEQIETPDGMIFKPKPDARLSPEQRQFNIRHLVCKILAAGYILHDFRNFAQMKAIIAVDHEESAVGRSEGGTGKSIYCTMFEHLVPTVVIDGKKTRLQEDPYLYNQVDERTQAIVFDDCRVNLDFEHFLSQITRGVEVNAKYQEQFRVPAPKMLFSTNHAVNGEGNSFRRRQYYISFSDYYHAHRTPQDEFGHNLFWEWDPQQWNLFYNWMAACVQTYLRYPDLNAYQIPEGQIIRRQKRQFIGEAFLDFMDTWWSDKINHAVAKDWAMEEYLRRAPSERRHMKPHIFKAKVKSYCEYEGYTFNPDGDSRGRIRTGPHELFVVADADYDLARRQNLGLDV